MLLPWKRHFWWTGVTEINFLRGARETFRTERTTLNENMSANSDIIPTCNNTYRPNDMSSFLNTLVKLHHGVVMLHGMDTSSIE